MEEEDFEPGQVSRAFESRMIETGDVGAKRA